MRDNQPTEQLKIELLSQWKLEAESRKKFSFRYFAATLFSARLGGLLLRGGLSLWKEMVV